MPKDPRLHTNCALSLHPESLTEARQTRSRPQEHATQRSWFSVQHEAKLLGQAPTSIKTHISTSSAPPSRTAHKSFESNRRRADQCVRKRVLLKNERAQSFTVPQPYSTKRPGWARRRARNPADRSGHCPCRSVGSAGALSARAPGPRGGAGQPGAKPGTTPPRERDPPIYRVQGGAPPEVPRKIDTSKSEKAGPRQTNVSYNMRVGSPWSSK